MMYRAYRRLLLVLITAVFFCAWATVVWFVGRNLLQDFLQ